jgi:CDP-diacylglycerol--glycerol-3-phosphate 3-phosphatidyltransferase
METVNQRRLQRLRVQWGIVGLGGALGWLAFFGWLSTWWEAACAGRWLLVSGLALSYILWVVWKGLEDNHRPGEKDLMPTLGMGNVISMMRGMILALFLGFTFSPRPQVNWTSWLPGLLYTLATLPDFADGAAARLSNHVTRLGETLDMSIDSLGVLGVSLLAVQYGQVPWWFLLVGLARTIFLAGIWLRQKLGLPVYDLPFSVRRRGYAALTMGLFFVILYPVFEPPGTHIAAGVFASYLLAGFVWDWLVTVGRLPQKPGEGYLRLEKWIVNFIPLLLRGTLLLWGLTFLWPALRSQGASPALLVETIAAAGVILGFAGRVMAVVALVILGLQPGVGPLVWMQQVLILVYANLLFLGTGILSLWPVEDGLIFHRIGDPRT